MTIDEFKKTKWGAGMMASYKGNIYDIASANFEESLVGLDDGNEDDYLWVRCENIDLVT